MTPAAVFEKYGLTPKQYPDFAALRGDPSDNLPSLAGVGEKTATKWIAEYGSLEALLKKSDEISGKVGESLRAGIEQVKLNHELTHLIRDVDVELEIEDLEVAVKDFKALREIFDRLEFRALKDRINKMDNSSESISPPITKKEKITENVKITTIENLKDLNAYPNPLNKNELLKIDFKNILYVGAQNGLKFHIIEQEAYTGTTELDCVKENAIALNNLDWRA